MFQEEVDRDIVGETQSRREIVKKFEGRAKGALRNTPTKREK